MKPSAVKKYRRRFDFHETLSEVNPFLLLGVDLPFIVVSATSLRTGVALSIELFIIHMTTMLFVFLLARSLRVWQRAAVTAVISTVSMVFARQFVLYLFPDLINFVRMHLYLMGINGITMISGLFMKKDAKLKAVAKSSFANSVAFGFLMVVMGGLREYIGHGTLWGQKLPSLLKIEAASAPFFGFILLGFLLVFFRWLVRRVSVMRIQEKVYKEKVASHQDAVGVAPKEQEE